MEIIWTINLALGKLFDIILSPFAAVNPFWGLAFISLLTGAIMVFIFKYVSNQDGIHRAKAKVRGHFLEVWLYKHDFKVVTGSIGRILKANFIYMRYAVAPLLVMIVPVVLIMIQLNLHYGFEPLKPGSRASVIIKWNDAQAMKDSTLSASADKGLSIETTPLTAAVKKETSWRIKAKSSGKHSFTISWGGKSVSKEIVVGSNRVTGLAPYKSTVASLNDAIFSPGEKPISQDMGIQRISIVSYPEAKIAILGMEMHWIIIFFILSIVAGFALKGVFGVEI